MTAVFAFATTKPERPGWQRWAACRGADPELFFPQRGEPPKPAKKICASCLVRSDCLAYAMTEPFERFGIWGGMSERERRKLRRDLALGRRQRAS